MKPLPELVPSLLVIQIHIGQCVQTALNLEQKKTMIKKIITLEPSRPGSNL